MGTLRIIRSSEWANKLRAIGIYVNGNKVGEVKNGETKEFEVPDGMNEISAKIDWCGSNKLNLMFSGNGTKTVELTSFAKHSRFGIFAASYYTIFAKDKFLRLTER